MTSAGRAGRARLAPASARSHGRPRARARRENGQISVLILGFTVIALMLVLAAVDVTAAQLGRVRLMDAADAAALDAADELAERMAYTSGITDAVPITTESVRQAASAYLDRQPRPGGIAGWALAPGTGTTDGRTAVVRLTGTVELPISGLLRSAFGGSITITAESHARAAVG